MLSGLGESGAHLATPLLRQLSKPVVDHTRRRAVGAYRGQARRRSTAILVTDAGLAHALEEEMMRVF